MGASVSFKHNEKKKRIKLICTLQECTDFDVFLKFSIHLGNKINPNSQKIANVAKITFLFGINHLLNCI